MECGGGRQLGSDELQVVDRQQAELVAEEHVLGFGGKSQQHELERPTRGAIVAGSLNECSTESTGFASAVRSRS